MTIRVLATSLFLILLSVSSSCSMPAEPPSVEPKSSDVRRQQPKRTDADEGPVSVSQLNYHDPSIRVLLAEMETTAEEIAGDDWLHDPWHQRRHRPDYHDYTASWGTTRTRSGFLSNSWPDRPLHKIQLIASPQQKHSNEIWDATVIASWYPAGKNVWGAHVLYSSSLFARPRDVQRDNFSILFRRSNDFELSLPGREYFGKRKFGEVEYQFSVRDSPTLDRDIRPYLVSPESMRDHAIEVINYLAGRLQNEIPSGKAITSLTDPSLPLPEHPQQADAQTLRPPFPPRYHLTKAQRDMILDQALSDLNLRKTLWRDNYLELYAAAHRAFPIKRLFAVEDDRRKRDRTESGAN